MIPCILIVYFRAQLSIKSANGNIPSSKLITTVQLIYFLITACQLISGLVLADALRRIIVALKDNMYMKANEKTMCLHVFMLLIHVLILTITAFFVFRAFSSPDNLTYDYEQAASRIALFFSAVAV